MLSACPAGGWCSKSGVALQPLANWFTAATTNPRLGFSSSFVLFLTPSAAYCFVTRKITNPDLISFVSGDKDLRGGGDQF